MGLLKTKRTHKILRGKRSGVQHKTKKVNLSRVQEMKTRVNRKSTNLKKSTHGLRKDLLRKQNQKIQSEQEKEAKKAIRKQQKEAEDDDDLDDYHNEEGVGNDGYYFPKEQFEVNDEDDAILRQFNLVIDDQKKKKRRNSYLGEIIFDKIEEKFQEEEEKAIQESILNDPKVQAVYGDIAKILKEYRSGKLPKAFKFIPVMDQWDKVLGLTRPHEWTPNAMRIATKMFSSSLDMFRAQQFYENILLPAVRKDIRDNHKLHVQYYMALKDAFYKPGAWFKGIIFPLCNSKNCSIREATIIASVLKKLSIPSLHSSAALMILADMEYSASVFIFAKSLIEKKYSLPIRCLTSLIDMFRRFEDNQGVMPVIWQQTLLVFCSLYSKEFDEMQKESLKRLVKKKNHHLISSEILKAIDNKSKEDIIKQNLNKSFNMDKKGLDLE